MTTSSFKNHFPRRSFAKHRGIDHPFPHLLRIQRRSFDQFVGAGDFTANKSGIDASLKLIFPIESNNGLVKLEYTGEYTLDPSHYDIQTCRDYGLSYVAQLRVKLTLTVYTRNKSGQKKLRHRITEFVYMGEIPMMTPTCSFVINGTERVVISQLHRSPGVFFESDKSKTNAGKLLYQARIIPYHGPWIDFEFGAQDRLYFRVDRRKKIPATVLLRAFGMNEGEILSTFFESHVFKFQKDGTAKVKMAPEKLRGVFLSFDVKKGKEVLLRKGTRVASRQIREMNVKNIDSFHVDKGYMIGRPLATDVVNPQTGEILVPRNTLLTEEHLSTFMGADVKSIGLLYTNELDTGDYISRTLSIDHASGEATAMSEIFQSIRPGDLPSESAARSTFESMFKDSRRYSLSSVGRMKLNIHTHRPLDEGGNLLSLEDIVETIRALIELRDGKRALEDVDSLSNRRMRCVGEMLENQLRIGLSRMERNLRDELSIMDFEKKFNPKDFINAKPISVPIREFFTSGQMSQFMDQNNPLAEVTHKRRVTALGPGGVSRERSGFEVRDVHATHYGRLCPIETPEGPNIGLINSLATFADVNEYGFLVTPYYVVKKGKITKEVVHCSALEEQGKVIVQANTLLKNGAIVDEMVMTRVNSEYEIRSRNEVNLIEVSPRQIVSVGASLIPFLEHDDANRALMGSNMQRQGTPLVNCERPLVGTGVEGVVARDGGVVVMAERGGKIIDVDASRIVVEVNQGERGDTVGVDIYHLTKYLRTNQDTCFNQFPIVSIGDKVKKGDVLADSMSTDNGELAIGQNIRIAFMSWNGYNYEDSILISEKILRDDAFTSVHIEEMVCYARTTKSGDEEITAEIPGVSEAMLSKLDESGIIRIGAEVKAGDILVGKITPRGEIQHTPEERLMKAIFGDKSDEVKDTSLRMKPGMRGTVIGVQVYTRGANVRSKRAEEIKNTRLKQLAKDYETERYALQGSYDTLRRALIGKAYILNDKEEKATVELVKNLSSEALLALYCTDDVVSNLQIQLINYEQSVKEAYDMRQGMVKSSVDLPPSTLQMIKVFIAVKRRIQPGDKMAGRHGNKGVVSAIMPIEDMPYDESGEPVDIILSPLGVPSRMNVGQIIETHLGAAVNGIGRRIAKMVEDERNAQLKEMQALLKEFYKDDDSTWIDKLSDEDLIECARRAKKGIPVATPVFSGATEEEVDRMLSLAGLDIDGKCVLHDGRTGEAFDSRVTVGYMYIMKLNHLIDDKMHARSTGSYSLVTQQPLGGKSQFGGQRFGEMEVWALEAYGAAHILREMLTVKSDDILGRRNMYSAIVRGQEYHNVGLPESFNVLVREIRSLGLNIDTE